MEHSKQLPRRNKAPWHLWVVGAFFLTMSLAGVWDYALAVTLNREYFDAQGYSAAIIAYFTDYPIVPKVFWTISIAASAVAPVLLMLRTRWAVLTALTAAGSNLCLALLTFGFRDRWNVFGPWLSLFDLGILVLLFGLWWYCRAMLGRGVLR